MAAEAAERSAQDLRTLFVELLGVTPLQFRLFQQGRTLDEVEAEVAAEEALRAVALDDDPVRNAGVAAGADADAQDGANAPGADAAMVGQDQSSGDANGMQEAAEDGAERGANAAAGAEPKAPAEEMEEREEAGQPPSGNAPAQPAPKEDGSAADPDAAPADGSAAPASYDQVSAAEHALEAEDAAGFAEAVRAADLDMRYGGLFTADTTLASVAQLAGMDERWASAPEDVRSSVFADVLQSVIDARAEEQAHLQDRFRPAMHAWLARRSTPADAAWSEVAAVRPGRLAQLPAPFAKALFEEYVAALADKEVRCCSKACCDIFDSDMWIIVLAVAAQQMHNAALCLHACINIASLHAMPAPHFHTTAKPERDWLACRKRGTARQRQQRRVNRRSGGARQRQRARKSGSRRRNARWRSRPSARCSRKP